tara:strand:- start:66 stop:425 length:360 start_codon:yes stop_codon:yes gene_type:complete
MIFNNIISIGKQTFNVSLAKKTEEIQKGLMFQTELPKNSGMLFIYRYEDYHWIWMKNTYIPLDVIWFDENRIVVHKQTLYSGSLKKVTPPEKSKYILEVAANTFDGNVGDIMLFNKELK